MTLVVGPSLALPRSTPKYLMLVRGGLGEIETLLAFFDPNLLSSH